MRLLFQKYEKYVGLLMILVITLINSGIIDLIGHSRLAQADFGENLVVFCSASETSVSLGQSVTWTADVFGGTAPYTYAWSGSDNLGGTADVVSKTYTTTGMKTASVTVADDSGQFVTKQCGSLLVTSGPSVLSVFCTVNEVAIYAGQSATWNASATGGTAPYTYAWSGTDTLTGSGTSVTKTYTTTGTKTGSVTVSDSLGQVVTMPCSNGLEVSNQPDPLSVACSVLPLTATTGMVVTWMATVSGGVGSPVSYSWSGTDGLVGTTETTSKTYSTVGSKSGTITVSDGSQVVSDVCTTTVVAPPPQSATLIVKKVVVNDHGGTATPEDFTIRVKSGGVDVVGSPFTGSVTGVSLELPAGSYIVSENDPTGLGYALESITGQCSANGTVTLLSGQMKECILTNDDVYVPPPPPPVIAQCVATPGTAEVNQPITWTVTASGGNGVYDYAWSGAEGLTGTGLSVIKAYSATGTKDASVVVTSGSSAVSTTCTASITEPTVPPEPTPLRAACVITTNSSRIGTPITYSAQVSGGAGSYTYEWAGSDGLSGTDTSITQSYNSYGTKTAYVTVTSGVESVTSNLCSANIVPETPCVYGCGGFDAPNVVLYKQAASSTLASLQFGSSFVFLTQQMFAPRVAGVYLSQVPYTGVTETVAVIIFVVAIVVWSLSVAFAVESRRFSFAAVMNKILSLRKRGRVSVGPLSQEEGEEERPSSPVMEYGINNNEQPIINSQVITSASMNTTASFIPANLPTDEVQATTTVPQPVRDAIFMRARERKALVSEEAGRAIAVAAQNKTDRAIELLDGAITRAEEKYLKEDGWILLNREKVQTFLKEQGIKIDVPVEPVPVAKSPVAPPPQVVRSDDRRPKTETVRHEQPKVVPPPVMQPVRDIIGARAVAAETNVSSLATGNHTAQFTIGSAVSFLKAIVSGDGKSVIDAVRAIKSSGGSIETFATDLILELDRAYRARVEGDASLADQEIARIVAPWGARDLEEVIAILFSIAEHEYQSENTGLKLVALRIARLRR